MIRLISLCPVVSCLALLPHSAHAQFRDRPNDPIREAVADEIRRETLHREMRHLELEEEQTKRWAAAMESELRAAESRLEDQVRMNRVLMQQLQVAGEEKKAAEVEAKVKDQVDGLQNRRRELQQELEQRRADLQERRERLQAELRGDEPPASERPASFREHVQAAVRHMAEAADHFESAGMRRQAERLRDQLRELERELRDDAPADPPREREQPDTRRLIEAIERLHERMEQIEEKLEQLDDK